MTEWEDERRELTLTGVLVELASSGVHNGRYDEDSTHELSVKERGLDDVSLRGEKKRERMVVVVSAPARRCPTRKKLIRTMLFHPR